MGVTFLQRRARWLAVLILATSIAPLCHGLAPSGDAGVAVEFQPSFCIAHDEVQWSTCAGIIGADTVFWDPQLAVPMHEPTAADAGLVKGPLNSISHTSVGCQIVARRFSCYASWGECTPSVTQTVITRSGGQYEYDGNVWPGKVLTSAADVDKFVLKAPRDLCEGYMAGCSEEERTDAYEKFFNLLHLFRSITKRTDEEARVLAASYFRPDCSDNKRFVDRERKLVMCPLTGIVAPEPPLTTSKTAEALPEYPKGWCSGLVPGLGCCSVVQQADLQKRTGLLLRGFGVDPEVTEGECGLMVQTLLCTQGCGLGQLDTVKFEGPPGREHASVAFKVGFNMCEQLSRSCGCEVSPQNGARLETFANGSVAMCNYFAQALLPHAQIGNTQVSSVRVEVAAEGTVGAVTLGTERLELSCEYEQTDSAALVSALPPLGKRCTTHGEPHAPAPVEGDGGMCKAFLEPGEETCCVGSHMTTLNLNLKLMAGVLRSSACGHEFGKLACTTLCSPSQWNFATTSHPHKNKDGSLNVTVRVADEWCQSITDVCALEVDPRDQTRFADKFSDPTVLCAQIGPYLNMMLEPGPETPRYAFVPTSLGEEGKEGGDRMLSELVCSDRRTCDEPEDSCPLSPDGHAPYAWSASALVTGLEPEPFGACTEHAKSACCSQEDAEVLANWSQTKARDRLGVALKRADPFCAANLTSLFCGVGCSADQRLFVEVPTDVEVEGPSVFVLPEACSQLFTVCGGSGSLDLHRRGITNGRSFCAAIGEMLAELAPVRPLPGTSPGPPKRVAGKIVSSALPPPVLKLGTGRSKATQWGKSIVGARTAVVGETCPLADDEPIHPVPPPEGSEPGTHGLELCTQHEGSACCYAASEHILASKLQLLKRNFGGSKGACLPKVLALTCMTACSPLSSYFTSVQRTPTGELLPLPDGSLNATYYMTRTYCDDLFSTCRDAYSEIFGDYQGNLYASSTLFCESFSVTSDPTYKPGPGKATLLAKVGTSPETGLAIGDPRMPGGGEPTPVPDLDAAIAAGPQAACLQTEALERPLGFCRRFAAPSLSCCEVELEETIGGNLTEIAGRLFGHGCCFERLSDLVCGLACSPHQADYMSNVTTNSDGSFNVTVFIDPTLGEQLWAACAKHKMLATTTVETYFEGPADLLARIASGVQTQQVKQLSIQIGPNPNSGIGVGGASESSAQCRDPPPISELSVLAGYTELPTDPLLPPGMIPMYLLLFALTLGLSFAAVLKLCGTKLLAHAPVPLPAGKPSAKPSHANSDTASDAGAGTSNGAAASSARNSSNGGLLLPPSAPAYGDSSATTINGSATPNGTAHGVGSNVISHAAPQDVDRRSASPTKNGTSSGAPIGISRTASLNSSLEGTGKRASSVVGSESFNQAFNPGHALAAEAAHKAAAEAFGNGWAGQLFEAIEEFYFQLGHFFASKPSYALVPLAIILTWSVGQLSDLRMQSKPSELWVAQGTPSIWQAAFVQERFGAQRHEVMIITTKVPGGDVLFPAFLEEAAAVEAQLRSLSFTKDGATATLEEVCSRVQCRSADALQETTCLVQSPLKYWPRETFRTDPNLYLTVSNLAAKDECGIPILRKTVFGGLETDEHGIVTRATSLMIAILLEPEPFAKSRAWEYGFLDVAARANEKARHIQVSYMAQVSQDEEVARLASADVPLLVGSYVMMILYVVFAMWGGHRTSSHVLLGLTGVALVICSIVVMLGLTVLLDVPFTPVSTQVLPFLLLGIGVDNIFILSNTYIARLRDPSSASIAAADLVGAVLAQVGPTITLTSTSTTLAFAVGSLSVMPAVKYFCMQCVLGFAVNLLFQLTVFSVALAADVRRVRKRRLDLIPCCTPCVADVPSAQHAPRIWRTATGPPFARSYPPPPPPEDVEDGLGKFLSGPYVAWICRPATQKGVLLAFGVLFFGALSHALQVKQGLEIGEVLPKGSYMATFFDRFEFYSDIGPPVYLVAASASAVPGGVAGSTIDFASHHTQDVLGELVTALELSPWIKPPALDWLGDFQKYLLVVSNHTQEMIDSAGRIPPDKFYPWLAEFLAPGSDFAFYANYLGFNEDGTLESAQVMGFHIPLQSTDTFVQAMLDMRALCEPYQQSLGISVFPYSEYHIFYEQYAILVPQASTLLFSAIVMILLVMSLLLGNMALSIPVLLLLTLNQIDLIGIMQLANVHMNGISIINLVMAIGLSVEYLAHIASTYNMAAGDHVQKLRIAMASVGSSVVSGGITTLLGVVVLAFAKYPVFQVYYFRMYLSTVLCGSLHGLVLLPVVLGVFSSRQPPPAAAAPGAEDGRLYQQMH